jgi:hypothetical protein
MNTRKHIIPASLTAAIALASGLAAATGTGASETGATATGNNEHKSIAAAIKGGSAKLEFRLRHEEVDVDNASQDEARGLTLRTRLNYTTGLYQGFGATVEMDNITEIDGNGYPTSPALKNSGNFPGKSIIADPTGTEINQAYVSYSYGSTTGKYGRQRINLDNQRFIGGVGFRQNEQTFDAVSLAHTFTAADTKVYYAHINNVNRIFGEDDPALSDTDSSTELFNINYSGFKTGELVFYSYLLDEEQSDTQYDTYGLRFNGKTNGVGYQLEYATQDREMASGNKMDADYILLEGSVDLAAATFTLGFENLQSDNGNYGFSTPLATGHKFQGWTDQFLNTPSEGIEDIYLSIGAKFNGVKLLAVYHDFKADVENSVGDDDLGSELGLLALKQCGDYTVSFKYASYEAGDSSFNKSDTDKFWLTVSGAF